MNYAKYKPTPLIQELRQIFKLGLEYLNIIEYIIKYQGKPVNTQCPGIVNEMDWA